MGVPPGQWAEPNYPSVINKPGVRLLARRTFTTPKIRTFTTPKFGHFPPPKTLKTHKLTHSGEKPYACDQYKYSSALAQALNRHKLTLGGERLCHSEKNCLC